MKRRTALSLLPGFGLAATVQAQPAAELPDLASVAPDLQVPAVTNEAPGAGRRVRMVTPGWEGTAVHCTLFLPPDWTPEARLPVLVDLPGNGGYENAFGDVCDGSVEGCRLGYGLSGGRGMIWVCAPFVEVTNLSEKRNAVKWWGSVAETKRHLAATVREVCARWGGDAQRVVLCGFSRGSIGCNYIGLHDDDIATLWRAFVCHSHYDGARENWPYEEAGRGAAQARLRRLGDRPQWISHEGATKATEDWLASSGVAGNWAFTALPFRNHSDAWVLRPLPERERARQWLAAALEQR